LKKKKQKLAPLALYLYYILTLRLVTD